MFKTPSTKYVLPELIVSEKKCLFHAKIYISVISIIKNHPRKVRFGLLNIIFNPISRSWMDQFSNMIRYLVEFLQDFCGILIESHWNYQGI